MKDTIIIFQKDGDTRKIQEYCFRQGCIWGRGEAKYIDIRKTTDQDVYIRICNNILTYGELFYLYDIDDYEVFTSEQFKRKFIKNKLNI